MKPISKKFTIPMLKNIESIEMTVKHDDINNITSIRKFLIKCSDKDDYEIIYYIYTPEEKILRNGEVVSRRVISKFGKANVPSYTLLVPFSHNGDGYRILEEHLVKGLNLIKEGFDTNWKDFDWEVTEFKINNKSSMKGYYASAPRKKTTCAKKRVLLPSEDKCPVKVNLRKMI